MTTESVKIQPELFKLHDTYGVPLSVSLVACQEQNVLPDWPKFFADAKRAGWPIDRVERVGREALSDSGYPDTWKGVLDKVFNWVVFGIGASAIPRTGYPTGGSFTVTSGGVTSEPIPHNADAEQVSQVIREMGQSQE